MPAIGVNAEVDYVYNVLDDLAESKCYDSKIVAFQTKNGDTDNCTENSGKGCANEYCKDKSYRSGCDSVLCEL